MLALALSYFVVPGSTAFAGCGGDPVGSGLAADVTDGRTFSLTDGRQVRLAGIEVPGAATPALADSAKATLAKLVGGQTVTFTRLDASTDRYGRHHVHALIERDGASRSVQADLLAQGQAFVAARVGDSACLREFLALERQSRADKLGLWGDPYYEPRRADMPAEILAERGRFALIQGRVSSVRESRGTIYVNFGARWSQGFAMTIAKNNANLFKTAGLEPKTLNGRWIRVRGWIQGTIGPRIHATRPEQIEIVEPN